MLRLVLDRGDAAIPSESMFLLDIDKRRTPDELVREIWSHPRVKLWNLPAEPPSVPPGLSREEAFRFAVSSPYVAYAHREGKSRSVSILNDLSSRLRPCGSA